MSTNQPAVSKPLLITFVIVALIGIAYYVWQGQVNREDNISGVVPVPENLPPVDPKVQQGEPQPAAYK